MNIIRAIEQYAYTKPEHPAYILKDTSITYKELKERSDALASWMLETYPGNKQPVIVYGHMEIEMVICFLACVKSGHAYIPIDDTLPGERINKVIENASPCLLFAVSPLPEEVSLQKVPVIKKETASSSLGIEEIIHTYINRSPEPAHSVGEHDNFYIIYTSGSTGEPKGVEITQYCLVSFLQWISEDFADPGASVCMNQSPYSFDLSVMPLYGTLTNGGTVVAVDKSLYFKPKRLVAALQKHAVKVWVSTPSFMNLHLDNPAFSSESLPDLIKFYYCGESLPNNTARNVRDRFPGSVQINTYGPTEATVAVTSVVLDNDMIDSPTPIPLGYKKNDCDIFVIDHEGEAVREGDIGEIVISGPCVSTGYLNNPGLTAARFFELNGQRAYRTGDYGYYRNGLLYFGGRKDFQVKMHGYRIEMEDIEHNIRTVPYVENALVFPHETDGQYDYFVAMVALYAHAAVSFSNEAEFVQDIKRELANTLPAYMIPREFIVIPHMPMNTSGKADRKKLVEQYLNAEAQKV